MLYETVLDLPCAQVEQDLRRRWPEAPLWFPVCAGDHFHPSHPFNLFVFVRHPAPTPSLYTLARSRYVDSILMDGPVPAVFRDADLQRVAHVRETVWIRGEMVHVTRGPFEGLSGIVRRAEPQAVQIRVRLYSGSTVISVAADDLRGI